MADYQKRFPHYKLVKDPARGTVMFEHAEGVTYSVEELLGMVLAHAKSQAEAYTEQKIKVQAEAAPELGIWGLRFC